MLTVPSGSGRCLFRGHDVAGGANVSIWDTDHFIEPAAASDVYCQYVWTQPALRSPWAS